MNRYLLGVILFVFGIYCSLLGHITHSTNRVIEANRQDMAEFKQELLKRDTQAIKEALEEVFAIR